MFSNKTDLPNGFTSLPSMKDTAFVVSHSEIPDYFSISNSSFIFSEAMKMSSKATEMANATGTFSLVK